ADGDAPGTAEGETPKQSAKAAKSTKATTPGAGKTVKPSETEAAADDEPAPEPRETEKPEQATKVAKSAEVTAPGATTTTEPSEPQTIEDVGEAEQTPPAGEAADEVEEPTESPEAAPAEPPRRWWRRR